MPWFGEDGHIWCHFIATTIRVKKKKGLADITWPSPHHAWTSAFSISPVAPSNHFSFNGTVSITTIYSASLECFQKERMSAAKFRLNFRKVLVNPIFQLGLVKRQATSDNSGSRSPITVGVAMGQHEVCWHLSSTAAMNNGWNCVKATSQWRRSISD